DRNYLENILIKIQIFLNTKLKLELHPDKAFIKTLASGVDFLGFVYFPNHRVLRTSTKRRMNRNLKGNNYKLESLNSYLGMLKHWNCHRLSEKILNKIKEIL